jgi:hypothetical protein
MDASTSKPVKRRSRSARAADKKLSRAFAQANARYRKKDGSLRTDVHKRTSQSWHNVYERRCDVV